MYHPVQKSPAQWYTLPKSSEFRAQLVALQGSMKQLPSETQARPQKVSWPMTHSLLNQTSPLCDLSAGDTGFFTTRQLGVFRDINWPIGASSVDWDSNHPLLILGLQETDNEGHLGRCSPKISPRTNHLAWEMIGNAKSQILLWTHSLRCSGEEPSNLI